LVWAFALYKIPKKFNIISLAFPLIVLAYTCGELAFNLAIGMFIIEMVYWILIVSSIPLIISIIGIFFVFNETYEFSNKKKAYSLIIFGTIIFMFIVGVYYFHSYGGKLDNIYFSRETFDARPKYEIDPMSTYSARTLSRAYIFFNSSGIVTQYINEKHDDGCSMYLFKNKFLSGQNIQKELCCIDYGTGPDFRICKSSDGNYQNLWYVSYNKTYVIDTEVVIKDGNACFYNIPENPSVSGGKTCY